MTTLCAEAKDDIEPSTGAFVPMPDLGKRTLLGDQTIIEYCSFLYGLVYLSK